MTPMVLALSGGGFLLLLASAGGWVAYGKYGPRGRLRRRIEHLRPGVGPGGKEKPGQNTRKKAIQAKLKEIEEKRSKAGGTNTLKDRLAQTGLPITVKQFYIASAAFGTVVTLISLTKVPPLVAPAVFLAATIGLPRWFIGKLINRRLKAFTKDFANAIDVIVRGIRTGLPVGECLNMIGREFADPIGIEFRLITEGQRLGMTVEDVLGRATRRVGTAEMKFFAIVLVIQKQTGGNLADTLDKLSDVLRERKKMKDKITALSSEAKASAMIIGSLPFAVAGMLMLLNPVYLDPLFTESTGHLMLAGGGTWMMIGVLIMRKMINFDF